ncbi:MAG: hypothetical protein ACRDIY_12935, partial [Chloroflexota bacterium]
MSRTTLHPRQMGIGDLLDETFHLYRRHFFLLAASQAVFFVPLAVVQLALVPRSTGRLSSTPLFPGATAVYVALVLIGEVIVLGATMHAVSAAYLGETIGVRECYARACRRLWPLYRLSLLYGMAVFLMSVTIVGIPFAVFFSVGWGMAYPVLVLEGNGVRQAMGRSRVLVRSSWWRLFGLILLTTLLASILSSLFSTPSLIVT